MFQTNYEYKEPNEEKFREDGLLEALFIKHSFKTGIKRRGRECGNIEKRTVGKEVLIFYMQYSFHLKMPIEISCWVKASNRVLLLSVLKRFECWMEMSRIWLEAKSVSFNPSMCTFIVQAGVE